MSWQDQRGGLRHVDPLIKVFGGSTVVIIYSLLPFCIIGCLFSLFKEINADYLNFFFSFKYLAACIGSDSSWLHMHATRPQNILHLKNVTFKKNDPFSTCRIGGGVFKDADGHTASDQRTSLNLWRHQRPTNSSVSITLCMVQSIITKKKTKKKKTNSLLFRQRNVSNLNLRLFCYR